MRPVGDLRPGTATRWSTRVRLTTMESSDGRDASATDEGSDSATVVRPPPPVAFRPAPRVRRAGRSTGEGGPAGDEHRLSLAPRRRPDETSPGDRDRLSIA